MNSYEWYQQLRKPDWSPPSWLFGPVWSVLYLLIAVSYGYVGWQYIRHQLPAMVVAPFALNLIFNLLFTYVQFGLRSNVLAAIDILLVLATLVWALAAIWPYAHWVVLINIPYLVWVAFATVLQLNITYLNWK